MTEDQYIREAYKRGQEGRRGMNKTDELMELDDQIHSLLDENADLVELQGEKAKLLPRSCEQCGKDLSKDTLCEEGKTKDGEYVEWIDIRLESIGKRTYTCHKCMSKKE